MLGKLKSWLFIFVPEEDRLFIFGIFKVRIFILKKYQLPLPSQNQMAASLLKGMLCEQKINNKIFKMKVVGMARIYTNLRIPLPQIPSYTPHSLVCQTATL